MKKLNIMKEVKALLENKQRINLLSPSKHKQIEVTDVDEKQYKFPFHRRSSMGKQSDLQN